MSLYLPPEMRWLGWIAGAEWPDGDEDKAWAVSDVWKDAAEELLALIAAVDEAKAATMAAYSDGDARAEMGARYDRMRSGESSIETLAKYMQQTSDSTFDMGTELQAEKITIIVTLCWLAVEIALAWLFPPTAPAAEAAAVGTSRAILQAARTATQKAIQQLAAKLGAPTVQRSFWRSLLAGKPALPTAKGWGVVGSEVIQGAAEEALITGAVQAGQVADDKRRDMDWSEVGYSAAAGGFAEPIGGAVAKGLGKGFAGGFGFNKNFGGQLDNWWGRAGQNTVVGAISDGLAGIAGSLFVAGISGQSVSDTLTGVGVAGSFIQGGMVGLADPSTFGRAGFAASAAGEWGVGEGNRFGRSGEEGEFGNGSSDGSRSVDQFGRQPSPGPTQPQSFVGGQQMPADGPQVPNRPPGSDFAGSRSGPTGPGPSSSLEASSSVLSPAGGQSPTGSGAAPEVLGNGPTGQGDTDSLPGAGGERGAAGPSGGASFGAGGGGGSADSGGPAGGEGGAGGSNGAEDQQTHRDQPGGPGGSSGGEHPGTSEQQADESGSRPGATSAGPSAGGETGDRLGGTPDPGAQSFHTGGPPAFEASGSAPASGPVQAQVAAQTGGVTPAPGLASNPGPAQSAGSGQTTAAAQSGRTETLTGQSSSADRPGTTAGPPDTAASPEAQQNRQAPVSETAPPSSTAETSRPEPPVTGSSAVTGDADWADLIGGDLPGDLESRWIPQAVEAVISTHTAGTTATPTGLGGAGSVPAGPPSATPTKSGPEPMSSPSSPAQLPNSPGAPAQNSNPLNTSNHGSGGAQPGAAVPKQPQAGSNHPRPGADHLEARSGQPPGGPDRPEPRPDQLEHTPDPAGAGPDRSGAQPPSREGDPGRPKRAHSETGPSPEPPTKRARAEESAPGSPQAGEQETGSDDVQPTPVPVPAEGGPQRVSPAQQNPRAPRSPQNSEAQRSADEDEAEQFADEESDWDGWTDPESETGPEPPLFGRPEPPMVLGNPAQSRVYGPGLLAPLEDPQLQQDLEDALRGPDGNFVRYADPRTHPAGGNPYGRMINPGMSNSDSRGNNCAETALAGLASFYGVPMVAAPRFPDVVNGAIERRAGERGSPQRVFQMLRTGQESYADGRPVPEQYTAMDKWIRHLGPGSAAYVTSMWKQNDPVTGRPYPDDGSVIFEAHTTLIVYPEGAEGPVWWDPQSGEMTLGPSPDMVDRSAGVAFIPIPGDRVIAAEPDIGTTSPAPFPYRPPTGPLVVPTARSADQPRLQLPDPATSRTFGPGSSNPDLHPGLQQVLESALRNGSGGFVRGAHPGTHPSAAAPYGVLVNAGGPDVPGRRGNHFDAALSALSSFLGKPRVAAAQHPGSAGLGSRAADADTARRAARWAGGNLHRFPDEQPMTQQFTNLHNWVHHLGPDSAALVFSAVPERDPATGAILRDPQDQPVIRVHPTVVVHPPAAAGPVWWNAVTGETWDHPPADLVAITGKLRFIPIPPGSTVVESDHLRERSRRMPERAEWSTSTGTAPHTTPPAIDYLSMPEGELADRPPAPAGPGPRSVEPDVVAVGAPPGDPDPAGRPPGSQQDIAPRPRLDRPWPPMVLSNGTDARAYGPGWLAPLEDPAAQVRLENAMRDAGGDFVRYADPRSFPAKGTHYGELINPGVPAAPGRNKNCLECVVTGLMTFLGRPQVALPRFTRFVDGVADSGGSDGLDQTRLYEMLGNQTNDFADGTRTISEQFLAIHEYVRNLGPGSAAFVRFNWQPTDDRTGRGMHRNGIPVLSGHATLVVYPVGARGPVWWDPQGDIATDKPSLRLVHSTRWVGFVPVPPGRSVQESFASVGPVRPQPAAPEPAPAAVIAPEHGAPEPPQRLPDPAASRRVGPGELREVEHPGFQKALEDALRDDGGSFVVGADPRTYPRPDRPYGKLVNPGGGVLKGRGTNGFDAALSGLATFLGKPEVAAPRQPDQASPGNDRADERNGRTRAVQWLGSEPTGFDTSLPMDEQYTALHKWVRFLGPGSAALVLSAKPEVDPQSGAPVRNPDGEIAVGEPDPSLVVYPRNGAGPVWWNPLTGKTSPAPPQSLVGETAALNFVPIPPGRTIGTAIPGSPDTDNSAGVMDGSAATDRRSGAYIPAGGAPGRQPVSDRPDAGGRLAAPTGADAGGGGDRRGDRNVVPGGERGHGSDPAVSELAGLDGAGRLHRSGDERPESVGPADLSSADPDRTTPDRGGSGSHRIPGRRPFGAETTRAVLDGDRQVDPATAADDQRRDGGRGLGGVAAGTGRDVAGDGDHGVLNPAQPRPATAPQFTPEQSALIPQPAHERNPARWGPLEKADYQAVLEAAVYDGAAGFVQFAHPATTVVPGGAPLIELINGPGTSARGRDDNCEDCVLSLLATFLGKPQVAAPAIGPHERDMGNRGQARAERLLGSQMVRYDDGTRTIEEQYRLAHDRIAALGPGAMAYVVAVWHERDHNGHKVYDGRGEPRFAGSHSFGVVFPAGADGPVWCDPQVGGISDAPMARYIRDTAMVGFVISTPQRVLAAARTRADLESALSDGNGGFVPYADPRSYRKLMTDNSFGTDARISMYRAGIAGVASFLGSPRFAAPAWNDIEADGGPRAPHKLHEEGRTEVEHFFQKSMRTLDNGRRTITRQLDLIHERIADLGPESVALVEVTHRRGAEVVADECLLLIYPGGPSSAPVWWDPVKGATYRHETVTMLLDEPATDSILYVTAAAGDLIAGNLSALLVAPAHQGFSGSTVADKWAAGASPRAADTAETPEASAGPRPAPALLPPAQLSAISESALERMPGRWGELENFQHQLDLETAISDDDDDFVAFRHPGDESVPGGYPYIELINGPGMAAPGRNENCEDCVAALLSTFLGKPQVALPAVGPPGRDRGGHGIVKAERFLGSQVVFFGWEGQSIAEQYRSAHNRIAALGPGAMADVSIQWQDTDDQGRKRYNADGTPVRGDQHAIAVVFPADAPGPVWCDPQNGRTYDFPTPTMIDCTLAVAFVISTPQRVVQAAEHRAKLTAALDDGAGGVAIFRHPSGYKQLIAYNRFDPARCQHSIYRVGLAAAATFLGRPRFAAPSWNDVNTGGRPSVPQVLDSGGRRDVEEFFRGPLQTLQPADAPMAEQLGFLHELIQQPRFGTGSVVFVELTHRYQLPGAGGYEVADQCLLLVYPGSGAQPSEPVWWDPLTGTVYNHGALTQTVATDAVAMMFAAATADTLINGNFTSTPSSSTASTPDGPPESPSQARTGGGVDHPRPVLPEAHIAETVDGVDKPVDPRPPGYRGHGRIQRRRPIEWVLPTGFRAPGAPESWLPAGSVPAGTGDEQGSSEDGPGAAAALPEVDIPFTLGTDPPPE